MPSLYNPAQAVTVNSSGKVVRELGQSSTTACSGWRTAFRRNFDTWFRTPQSAAVLGVPDGAPRGMYNGQERMAAAHRLCLCVGRQDRDPRRLRHVLRPHPGQPDLLHAEQSSLRGKRVVSTTAISRTSPEARRSTLPGAPFRPSTRNSRFPIPSSSASASSATFPMACLPRLT